MAKNHINDFMYHGRTSLDKKEIPRLGSGKKILSELDQLVQKNEYLSTPLKGLDYSAKKIVIESIIYHLGHEDSLKFFETLFPELAKSNYVGQLDKNSFAGWEDGKNEVLVELDKNPSMVEGAKDVYIGGPAALFSAAIQV